MLLKKADGNNQSKTSIQTVMIVMNTAEENKTIAFKRFAERTKSFSKMKNIIADAVSDINDFKLDSYRSSVFELMK